MKRKRKSILWLSIQIWFFVLAMSICIPEAVAQREIKKIYETECSDMSSAAEGDCLKEAFDKLDHELNIKVTKLLKKISTAKSYSKSDEQQKLVVAKAIKEADRLWRALVKVECGELTEAQSWGGNGGTNDGYRCQIESTRSRLIFIERNSAYLYFYKYFK